MPKPHEMEGDTDGNSALLLRRRQAARKLKSFSYEDGNNNALAYQIAALASQNPDATITFCDSRRTPLVWYRDHKFPFDAADIDKRDLNELVATKAHDIMLAHRRHPDRMDTFSIRYDLSFFN